LVIRGFDRIFAEGSVAVFTIALGILKYLEKDILQLKTAAEILDNMKHGLLDKLPQDNFWKVRGRFSF
jgi:hypothetical protein